MQADTADDTSDDTEEEDESEAAWSAMNLPDMDDATRQLILDSIKANNASDEEENEDDLRQMLTQHASSPQNEDLAAATAAQDTTAAAGTLAVVQQAVGTVDALQTDSKNSQQTGLELSEAVSEQAGDDEGHTPSLSRAITLPPRKVDAESLKNYEQWDQEYWQNKEPEAVDATLAAAQIWSRIIRTPRKKGRHIIIDVCSPREHETDADAVDTSHGHLVRQVVATNDKKTWLGPGGYRLARKSRWGDLWPKYYQDYALTQPK